MPISNKESLMSSGTVTVEGNITTSPATTGIQKSLDYEGVNNAVLPSGASRMEIRCIDLANGAIITINNIDYGYNDVFFRQVETDLVNNKQDFVDAVNVVSNGKKYKLSVIFPSTNPVTINSIIQS